MNALLRIEENIKETFGIKSINDIPTLNDFKDFSQIQRLHMQKALKFNFKLQENIVNNFGSTSQIILEKFLYFSPIIMIILTIVIAIIRSNYVLLCGIPLTILGVLLTTPKIMKQGYSLAGIIMLSIVILGICIIPFNFSWGFLLLCYGIPNFFLTVNRELNIIVFEEAIFLSEFVFIYYFLRSEFQFIDLGTNKLYKNE